MVNLVSFRVSHYTRICFNPSVNPDSNMGGSQRMHDPTEAEHDQVRRRWMNVAFVAIVILNLAQWRVCSVTGWDWLLAALLALAGVPLGLAVKVFELRFKMSAAERRQMLGQLPRSRQLAFVAFAGFAIVAFVLGAKVVTWALWGVWFYDFVTYYHDRPERMRHLYAITKTLDELRDFPTPWAWVVPALVGAVLRAI